MSNVIVDHDWLGYLESIGHLGVDLDSVNIWPVMEILTGCIQQHYRRSSEMIINIQSLLYETYHKIINISTEVNIKGLFTTSLNTFTNYIRHTYQAVAVTSTIDSESTQCLSLVLSKAVLAQLMN